MAYQKRSKITAILLAFFGGMFGIHKFYLKEFSGGIFYIFLAMTISRTIFPLTTMLGVFDAIRLLFMSQDQFDRKYNNIPQNSPYRKPRNRNRQPVQRAAQQKVVQRTSRHNPFIKSADRFYKDYALEEAAADYAKALEIDPNNKKVLFNYACVQSLLENSEGSMEALKKLISLGYSDFEKIEKHDDLAFLRIQESFEKFKANGYKKSPTSVEVKIPEDDLLQDDLLLSQLNKLSELRKKGLLSENEFSIERKKLLRR